MSSAELHGKLQCTLAYIHGDNFACAGQPRSQDYVQPHASAAHYRHGASGFHLGGGDDGADTGGDTATDEGGLVQGQLLGTGNAGYLRYHRILGEAGEFR